MELKRQISKITSRS